MHYDKQLKKLALNQLTNELYSVLDKTVIEVITCLATNEYENYLGAHEYADMINKIIGELLSRLENRVNLDEII